MSVRGLTFGLLSLAVFALAACETSPGKPTLADVPINPESVSDFDALFSHNCAGCHGPNGRGGAALALNDPVYLAIADDATLRRISSNGIPGTSMAPFAQSAGGMLTAKQIELIVSGIRSRWAKPDALRGANPPAYAASEPGDAARGAAAYATFCSSCHGPSGKGGPKASSIVDGTFLALLTDQELRTMVIVGRPDLGAPDWRGNVPGKPMSSQEISDVVAWLASQRVPFPGQPYPAAVQPTGEKQ